MLHFYLLEPAEPVVQQQSGPWQALRSGWCRWQPVSALAGPAPSAPAAGLSPAGPARMSPGSGPEAAELKSRRDVRNGQETHISLLEPGNALSITPLLQTASQ